MSAITAKASRKMKKYAVLTREPRCFLGSFDFSWEQRKLGDIGETYTGLSGKTKADFGHGQARFVTYMNVFSNPISDPEMTEPIEIDPKQNEVEVGDVFFTTSSETPEEVGMSSVLLEKRGKTYLNSFCFGFRPSEKIDSYYLAYMLRSESARDKIILLAQGISRYNISKNKVMEIAVSLPSLDEQKLIGQYFRQLDNLITLHQRKCALLFSSFQALISMMFTTSTFSWEQRKAKELFVSTADKGYPELPVLSATQDRGMIRRDENSINIFHDKKNEAGYKRVLPGQFVIHLRSFQGGFAHSAIEGITSPAYTVFGFSEPEKHDSEYWKYVFTSKSFIRRLETVTYGIRDGRSISYDEFLTLGFVYPSKAEQTAIARYLDKLSDLITLHQRKCISFTGRAGRLISTVNKKRITSSWEQRKLGDIGKARSGVGFPDADQGGLTGVPFFKVSDMNSDGNENEMTVANNYVTAEQIADHRWSPITELPAIFFAKVGAAVMLNRKRLCRFPFLLDNNTMAYSLSPTKWDADFAKALFGTVDLTSLVQVGALPSYNAGDVESMEIYLPSLLEQEQIGAYFKHLDNLITLHQRKPFLMKWRTSDANRNQTNRLVL